MASNQVAKVFLLCRQTAGPPQPPGTPLVRGHLQPMLFLILGHHSGWQALLSQPRKQRSQANPVQRGKRGRAWPARHWARSRWCRPALGSLAAPTRPPPCRPTAQLCLVLPSPGRSCPDSPLVEENVAGPERAEIVRPQAAEPGQEGTPAGLFSAATCAAPKAGCGRASIGSKSSDLWSLLIAPQHPGSSQAECLCDGVWRKSVTRSPSTD